MLPAKGFAFNGNKKKVEQAPEQIREVVAVERASVEPVKATTGLSTTGLSGTAVRSMFGKSVATAIPTYSKSASAKAKEKKEKKVEKESVKRHIEPGRAAEEPVDELKEVPSIEDVVEDAFENIPVPTGEFSSDLQQMGDLIQEEEKKNPYDILYNL